jgi:energy-coupling factor transporter transmembrane protein EcfT
LPAPRRLSDYACQYLNHDSPLHRLGVGWKLLVSTLLSALAVGARTPGELLLLAIVTLLWYFAARLTLFDLWRDCRFFVLQALIVIALYCLQYGVVQGLLQGGRTSLLVILFFIPGAVLLRTTRTREVMAGLKRVIPYRISFLVFVSIRFVPFFLREMEEIAVAQRLRGARLLPRQQLDPRNWPELFHCLLLPLMVRALKIADEVALSAEARGFGMGTERTYLEVPEATELPPTPLRRHNELEPVINRKETSWPM